MTGAALTLPQLGFVLALSCGFAYFFAAGGRTFRHDDADVAGAALAHLSFLVCGALGGWVIEMRSPIARPNLIAGTVLLALALMLYEWARWAIRERGFAIAWSGEVPEALCERGPYRFVRHPVYASYLLAFLAMLAAMPGWATFAIFLLNTALFLHASWHDERALLRSELGEAYAAYRRRTGRFVPKFGVGEAPTGPA